LSMSHCLRRAGVDHLVVERDTVAHSWRTERWDTFCLVTPNWQCRLPGLPYDGDDPEGFMRRDELNAYLDRFLAKLDPPLEEGVSVQRLKRAQDGTFEIQTSRGELRADQVVIAAGNYHVPKIPRLAEKLPASLKQVHVSEYRNPSQLPEGAVLVVGTGQSGAQIAEDLHLEGRKVHLCVGSAPRVARRYRGRDVVAWLEDMGHYELGVDRHPLKEGVRDKANHYVTGRDGGRDIDLRKFALEGMQLHGRLLDVADGKLHLGTDLKQNLDNADTVSANIKKSIDEYIARSNLVAPAEAPYEPVWEPGPTESELDLAAANITSVVWCMGFASNFGWLEVPVFDGRGKPVHERGVSHSEGVYFVGLPWLYTWGSGRFSGVARDAEHVVHQLAKRLRAASHDALLS
ncbi:MAG TPA: MSMEG_0569 family flavin-dependent oxidoreductase, partial [Polyangiales bacterium]|nr:MSMEG_0569 family flavin-dependent oxidoreductase [Polyangiales bacterium]